MQELGFPDWVAQRIWLGTILFAAGTGVLFLMRTMGWRASEPSFARGMVVAAAIYMLSPYVLDYAARISVILLPWAALPWLIGMAMRAGREGGWRWPAWFAVVIALVGGVNATALLFAGIGPVLWFAYAMWVTKEIEVRRALAAVGRIGALTLGVSFWWIAGLWAQGKYGIPILRYTETYETVAKVSNAPELLRGLGYWFFYGDDKLGPWIEPSVAYTQHLWLIGAGYLLAIGGLLAAGALRWKQRGFFVVLLAVGTLIAVGSHPYDHPTPYGSIFARFARMDLGLALRSTPRAVPLIVLALAVMLGAGTRAVARWRPTLGLGVAITAVAVAVVNLPPLFTGQMVADNLQRPEDIPAYWQQDADYLQSQGDATRVLEIPGADFASYRWGNTVDPVLPGLMDRPYVARELIPYGSAPSADLLNALERRLQEGWYEPSSLATVAALMGVGEVNLRSDLQYERYRTPRPRNLWADIRATPGLGPPKTFGDPVPNRAIPSLPLVDEVALGTPPDAADPPPVAAFPVEQTRPIVRAEAADGVMIMSGSGEGIVDAAAAGIIGEGQPVLYSASFVKDPEGLQRALDDNAQLVLTDTNRRQARRWGTVRENVGYTERAGEKPLVDDPTDNRLDVFPGAGDDTRTVVQQRGVVRVDATGYGNPVSFTPDDRPANAIDGDPRTAWRVGAFSDVTGERWEVQLTAPTTTDHITLLQPITGSRNRFITTVRLRFDGRDPLDVPLDVSSRSAPGQTIDIGAHRFTTLSIEVRDTDVGYRPSYRGVSPVGFAEVGIPGVKVDEVVHLPTDLLTAAGPSSIDHSLDVVMTRQRSNPAEPARTDDEETSIQRAFDLPTPRGFAVEGDARLSARAPDAVLDTLLGRPPATDGGVTATSTARLDGDLGAIASSAIDGDPATAWQTPFAFVQGNVATYTSAQPVTFDHLDLVVFADGRHSVPTELTITADDGKSIVVPVAPIADDASHENATASQRVDLPRSITGKKIAIQLSAIRPVTTIDYYSETRVTMPVAIAEWGIDGLSVPPLAPTVDTGCLPLLQIDGETVHVRATGNTTDVLARGAMALTDCDGSGVQARAGEVRVGTAVGKDAGVDIDRVVLRSAAGGRALDRAPGEQRCRRTDGHGRELRPSVVQAAGRWRHGTVLARPRREPERRMEGHHEGRRLTRRADAHRRLRERLVRDADWVGPDRDHSHLDTPARRVDRHRPLCTRARSVSRAHRGGVGAAAVAYDVDARRRCADADHVAPLRRSEAIAGQDRHRHHRCGARARLRRRLARRRARRGDGARGSVVAACAARGDPARAGRARTRRALHPREAAPLLTRAVVRVADLLRQGPRARLDRRVDVARRSRGARSPRAIHRLVLFLFTGRESYDR